MDDNYNNNNNNNDENESLSTSSKHHALTHMVMGPVLRNRIFCRVEKMHVAGYVYATCSRETRAKPMCDICSETQKGANDLYSLSANNNIQSGPGTGTKYVCQRLDHML